MTCDECGKRVEAGRLPRGWRDHADRRWCDGCWSDAYVLRAVTLPVAHPVGATWDEFGAELRAAWEDATAAANLAVSRLVAADVVRTPDMRKLPSMPRTYLYPEIRGALPGMATQSVTALLQSVERRYRERRWEVVWLRRAAPPSYRYPTPCPVHRASWSAELGPDGEAYVSFRLRSTDAEHGSDRRWTVRLKGGKALGYQLRRYRQLVDGTAWQGELSVYRRKDKRVMCKMVGWFERAEPRTDRAGTLSVQTSSEALLTYQAPGRDMRISAQHHVPRWIAEHNRRLSGLAHDSKREKRVPKSRMRGIQHQRDEWVRKHHARIDTLIGQVSAEIVGYARRVRVERIELALADLGYVDSFPWHDLISKITYKASEHGIEVERVDDNDNDDSSGEVVT